MKTTTEATTRIVVVDDQDVVRAAFEVLLGTQPDFAVVGTAADGQRSIGLCRDLRPDVVLMDIRMPGMDGIEATRRILADPASGTTRVLILTTFDLDEHVYQALDAGASGFMLKDATAEQLFDAVRVVASGQALLAPVVTGRLIAEFSRLRRHRREPDALLQTLTARETDVLRLIAEGLSNPEIAARLMVGEETIKSHVSRILAKLGLRDRTQAVVVAYESGLVVPGDR